MVAAVCAWLGLGFYFGNKVERQLSAARACLASPDVNYEALLQMYQTAKEQAENPLVSRRVYHKAFEEYEKVKTTALFEAEEEQRLKALLDSASAKLAESAKLLKEKNCEAASEQAAGALKLLSESSFSSDVRKTRVSDLKAAAETQKKKTSAALEKEHKKAQAAETAPPPEKPKAASYPPEKPKPRAKPPEEKTEPYKAPKKETAAELPPPPNIDCQKARRDIVMKTTSAVRRRDFGGAKTAVSALTSSFEGTKLTAELEELKSWLGDISSRIEKAENIWLFARNSGEALAGKKIEMQNIHDSEIIKIEAGKIQAKSIEAKKDAPGIVIKKMVKIEDLDSDELASLLKLAAAASKAPQDTVFSFFLVSGDMIAARKLASGEKNKKVFSDFARVYFAEIISKEYEKVKDGPKGKRRIDDLRDKYSGMPEFDQTLLKIEKSGV